MAAFPTLRRGLPRVAGGESWPPAGIAPSSQPGTHQHRPNAQSGELTHVSPLDESGTPNAAPTRRKITPPEPREPKKFGMFTAPQWALIAVAGALITVTVVAGVVATAQWLLGTPTVHDFVARYPGALDLPANAPVGIPAWLGWQHFFNVFLMALVIRSGIQIRRESRPSAYWSPKWNPERKISLTIWLHQALDILWILNGVVFVALLAITGQWMKIVPLSWEVFPHALSAGLQYLSLDWPTENGWAHYNALQQISYFLTVFVAAPLAALTGVRMSGIWPKKAKLLNRLYPVELARAIHFPVMLYFIAFIVVHVALVFATGALRNLNHMYAAQGSMDPDAFAGNWTGFWIFAGSTIVIVAALLAARPSIVAPLARVFGSVSNR